MPISYNNYVHFTPFRHIFITHETIQPSFRSIPLEQSWLDRNIMHRWRPSPHLALDNSIEISYPVRSSTKRQPDASFVRLNKIYLIPRVYITVYLYLYLYSYNNNYHAKNIALHLLPLPHPLHPLNAIITIPLGSQHSILSICILRIIIASSINCT